MTSLTHILDMLEKAEGPDREIDREIGIAFGIPEVVCSVSGGSIIEGGPNYKVPKDGEVPWSVPCFSASIDAALELIERELPGFVVFDAQETVKGIWCVGLRKSGSEPFLAPIYRGDFKPLCLAILIALIKAKMEKM